MVSRGAAVLVLNPEPSSAGGTSVAPVLVLQMCQNVTSNTSKEGFLSHVVPAPVVLTWSHCCQHYALSGWGGIPGRSGIGSNVCHWIPSFVGPPVAA